MSDAIKIGPGPTGRFAWTEDPELELAGLWSVVEADGRGVALPVSEADARLLVYGSPYGGLSDEEAGRRWCAARGKRPCYSALLVGDRWEWFKPQNGGAPGFDECRLPAIVWHQLRDAEGRFSFLSEALAYAAVGRAVKELAAVLGGPADVV